MNGREVAILTTGAAIGIILALVPMPGSVLIASIGFALAFAVLHATRRAP